MCSLLIDRLKIDTFFLCTCLTAPSGAAILTAVISLAPSLGISTIASGVETEDQRPVSYTHLTLPTKRIV